jgi:hypothetical protein
MCLAPSACETELVPQTKRRFTLLRYQGFALSHDEVLQAHLPWGTLPVLLHVPGICASFPPKLCIFPACIQPGQSPFQRAPVATASFPGDSNNLVAGYILQRVTRYLEARKGHVPATRVLVVNQARRKHTLWGKGSFSDAAPSRATCIL